jgi:hypothetical protein
VPTFEAFDWATGFVREAEDFAFIGREIAHHFSRQNIRYVEAHFSPTVFRQRLTPQVIAEALCKGLDQVPAVDVRLVAELGRNLGPDGALRTVELVPVVVDRSWLETHVLQARRLVPVATKRGR